MRPPNGLVMLLGRDFQATQPKQSRVVAYSPLKPVFIEAQRTQ
jgi:hypothetical protein